MTFSEILSAVYADLNFQSSPASDVVTRIKRYVNQGARDILREPVLQRLVDSDTPYTFASVASQARYVVPEAVNRIHSIVERTNDLALQAMSLTQYRYVDPDAISTSGTPTHFVPIGRVGVAVQPSDSSNIYVDSTSASDTGTAYIEGLDSDGGRRIASVTMTGTTAVNFAASLSLVEIEDFYISANAVGTVTLHEDASGGTELAQITIGQKRPRYYAFYLWPTPAAAVTYYVDYRRELTELVQDADEPLIPSDFHDLLVQYARMREYEKTNDGRFDVAQAQYQEGLKRLKYWTQTGAQEMPVLGRGARVGRSRLGAYYPADYWV